MYESLAPVPGRFPDALGSRMRVSAGHIAANLKVFGEQPPPDAVPAVLAALYLLMDWKAHDPGAREGVDAYFARQLSPHQADDINSWRRWLSRNCDIDDPPADMDDPPAFDKLLPRLTQALGTVLALSPGQAAELQSQLRSCFDGTGPECPAEPSPEMEISKHGFQDEHPFSLIYIYYFFVLIGVSVLVLYFIFGLRIFGY